MTIKNLFLLDSLGALLSAVVLGFVLTKYEIFFGMPADVLRFLAIIPCVFALYSFLGFLIKTKNERLYLTIIAAANFLYCCLTMFYIYRFYFQLTIWGLSYFIGEIIIVVTLALYELRIAKTKAQNTEGGIRIGRKFWINGKTTVILAFQWLK